MYNIIADNIFLTLLFYRIFSIISYWIQNRTFFLILKYLIYSFLFRQRTFLQLFNCWRFLFLILYWSATTTYNLINIRSLTETEIRTDILFTLYIISLIFSSRLSFVANLLDLSFYTFYILYSSINFITVVQTLIYILIFVLQNALRLRESLYFYNFLIYWEFFVKYWLTLSQTSIAIFCLLFLI